MTRQEANRKIVELIITQIEGNPDLRFNQILSNLKINKERLNEQLQISGLEDLYNEEPTVTLLRIQEQIAHLNALS